MPLHIACPSCGAVMAIPPGAGGQMVACPTCQKLMTLPSEPPPPMMARPSVVTPARPTPAGPPSGRSRRRPDPDDVDDAPRPRRIKTGPPSTEAYVVGTVSLVGNVVLMFAVISGIIAVGIYGAPSRGSTNASRRTGTTSERPPPIRFPFTGLPGFDSAATTRKPISPPDLWVDQELPGTGVRIAAPAVMTPTDDQTIRGTRRQTWVHRAARTDPQYAVTVHTSATGGTVSVEAVDQEIQTAFRQAGLPAQLLRREVVQVGGRSVAEYTITTSTRGMVASDRSGRVACRQSGGSHSGRGVRKTTAVCFGYLDSVR